MFLHKTDVLVSLTGEHAYRSDVDAASNLAKSVKSVGFQCTYKFTALSPGGGNTAPCYILSCLQIIIICLFCG